MAAMPHMGKSQRAEDRVCPPSSPLPSCRPWSFAEIFRKTLIAFDTNPRIGISELAYMSWFQTPTLLNQQLTVPGYPAKLRPNASALSLAHDLHDQGQKSFATLTPTLEHGHAPIDARALVGR